jgi:membrane protein DedA with SNARE-associated domain
LTEDLLALVPVYGPALLMLATFLSCLALPVPASILMLAGGAFAAGGDLVLWQAALAALAGAVTGDQVGYLVGRGGSGVLNRLTARRPGRAALLGRARAFTAARGGAGVFLSRWLFSPLGPYVNFVAGAIGMAWVTFTAAGILGEVVWVALYTGAGYLFADRVESLAALAGNLSGALAAGLVTVLLGLALVRAARHPGRVRRGGTRDKAT